MVGKSFIHLVIFLIALQGQFHSVLSDFKIVDKWSNKVVFQTASDFVRTGCGSFLEKSYLIASDPLDACEVPSSPPSFFQLTNYIQHVFGGKPEDGRLYQWVLFAKDGGCDLKTKFRNAASAGYSGIIVGTDERHEEITHPGLLAEDDEEFIDVHLVHSLDIRVLSKEFSQFENFVVEPPGLSRCRDEYQRTWLRSRYVSLLIRTWKGIMDTIWQTILWALVTFGKVAKAVKTVLPVFYNRDTFSSIALYLASIVISITIMMVVSIQNNAKKLIKYRCVQQERKSSFTEPGQSQPEPSRTYTPPRAPPRPKPSTQQRVPVDHTLRHRINLHIDINEPLTKAKVNIAYRDMALKYHPDKNLHLDENELAKITEEFRSRKRSRDILLLYCTE